MRTKRAIAAENRALEQQLSDCQALLAALALEHGGRVTVRGEDLERVSVEAARRTLAVRVMTNGDMRVDFEAPELEITVEDEPCLST